MMDVTEAAPGPLRRVLGWLVGASGAAAIGAIVAYFFFNIASIADIALLVLGVFGVATGASLLSFGFFLASKVLLVRRAGCIAGIVFSVPTLLLFVFLVWSLFQPTKPALN